MTKKDDDVVKAKKAIENGDGNNRDEAKVHYYHELEKYKQKLSEMIDQLGLFCCFRSNNLSYLLNF